METYYSTSDSHDHGWEFQDCPTCGYNPVIERQIKEIIEGKGTVELRHNKPVSINSEELTDLIKGVVVKSWPKK
jgi:hypothetical protein